MMWQQTVTWVWKCAEAQQFSLDRMRKPSGRPGSGDLLALLSTISGKSVKSSSWDQAWSPGHAEVDTKTSVNCTCGTILPSASRAFTALLEHSRDLQHSWTGFWIDMFINLTKQLTKRGCLMGLQHALCGDYSICVSSFQSYCSLSREYYINFSFGKLLIVAIHEVVS